MKVGGGAYGKREKLTPESLDHAERVAIRVLQAGAFDRSGVGSFTFWISSHTPPDHILFLNAVDLREVVQRLGDETNAWRGKLIVLELVRRVWKGQTYMKYAVAPAGEWNDVLRPLESPPEGDETHRAAVKKCASAAKRSVKNRAKTGKRSVKKRATPTRPR